MIMSNRREAEEIPVEKNEKLQNNCDQTSRELKSQASEKSREAGDIYASTKQLAS